MHTYTLKQHRFALVSSPIECYSSEHSVPIEYGSFRQSVAESLTLGQFKLMLIFALDSWLKKKSGAK